MPGLVDAHTHLDKSYTPAYNQSGTLLEAIDLWRAFEEVGAAQKADVQTTVRRSRRRLPMGHRHAFPH
ncbi:MAG: hypothetical protein R2932_53135 [Caldilineaceae bacterium]